MAEVGCGGVRGLPKESFKPVKLNRHMVCCYAHQETNNPESEIVLSHGLCL